MSFANQELKEKEKNSGGKKTKKAETSKGFLDMWAVYQCTSLVDVTLIDEYLYLIHNGAFTARYNL